MINKKRNPDIFSIIFHHFFLIKILYVNKSIDWGANKSMFTNMEKK